MTECGLLDVGASCTSATPYISILIIALAAMLLLHLVMRSFEFFLDMGRRIAQLDPQGSIKPSVVDRLRGAPERAVRNARKIGGNRKRVITSRR